MQLDRLQNTLPNLLIRGLGEIVFEELEVRGLAGAGGSVRDITVDAENVRVAV